MNDLWHGFAYALGSAVAMAALGLAAKAWAWLTQQSKSDHNKGVMAYAPVVVRWIEQLRQPGRLFSELPPEQVLDRGIEEVLRKYPKADTPFVETCLEGAVHELKTEAVKIDQPKPSVVIASEGR